MSEIYKEITDFPGYYVSNYGNVKNSKRILKQSSTHLNYKFTMLNLNGIQKKMLVHRLVATAFIPNPENKPYVDHIDANPANNNVVNLKWTTPIENGIKRVVWGNTKHKHIHAMKNKFKVTVIENKKSKYLGYYTTIDEAIAARDEYLRHQTHTPRQAPGKQISYSNVNMEKWAINAKKCLKFLIDSFPEDDTARKPMRDSFIVAVEHLTTLSEYLVKEEHEALQKAKSPEDECPCATCKAERFVEVISALTKDQLMELIATESGIELSYAKPCEHKEPQNEITVVYEAQAGAGDSKYGAGKLIKIHEGESDQTFGNPK